jgi:hypothetical protein
MLYIILMQDQCRGLELCAGPRAVDWSTRRKRQDPVQKINSSAAIEPENRAGYPHIWTGKRKTTGGLGK